MKQRIYFTFIAGLAALFLLNSLSLLFSSFYVMMEVIDRGICQDVVNRSFDLAISQEASDSLGFNQTINTKAIKKHLTSNKEEGESTYFGRSENSFGKPGDRKKAKNEEESVRTKEGKNTKNEYENGENWNEEFVGLNALSSFNDRRKV